MEARTKNLLKNPAKGGIPAIENKIIEKVNANIGLFTPVAIQFAKYWMPLLNRSVMKKVELLLTNKLLHKKLTLFLNPELLQQSQEE